jgi:UDP-GlcNAc:undecaprenyl-phosphate GlcNAc-1-phosphate transferase
MTAGLWTFYGTLVVAGAAFTAVLLKLIIVLSHRRGWLDYPDYRKRHAYPVPPLGGVAIFVVLWGAIFVLMQVRPEALALFRHDSVTIFAGAIVIFLLGLYDDFRPVRAEGKLIMQTIVCIWLWVNGLGIFQLWVPTVGGVALGVWSLPVTLIWFILLVNAINIIDGMDALAGGVALIGLISVMIIGVRVQVADAVVLSLILAGALVGFLQYNRPPARVFLGDSGSLSLGYFFAVLALWLPIKRYTVVAVYVPILAVLVPLAESAWSIFRRLARGRTPTAADRGHLHYRLLEQGFTAGGVRLLFYGLSLIGVAFSLAVAYGNRRFWLVGFAIFVLSLCGGLYMLLRTPRGK